MDTKEAVSLRQRLELDILALLQKFTTDTELVPDRIDLETCDTTRVGQGAERSVMVTGVRVTVEI